jgi:hypothetical protein
VAASTVTAAIPTRAPVSTIVTGTVVTKEMEPRRETSNNKQTAAITEKAGHTGLTRIKTARIPEQKF